MRLAPNKKARWLAGLLPLSLMMGSCGESGSDAGKDLALSINPGRAAIVPGSDFSCAVRDSRSISERRVKFNSFKLQWKSTVATLYVSAIRVLITHPALGSGKYVATIDPTEIEAMLGQAGAKFPPATTSPAPVYASDSTTKPNSYGPCGLQVGGIKFASEPPAAFTTKAVVEVYGFAENETTKEQFPVKQTETVEVESYGF